MSYRFCERYTIGLTTWECDTKKTLAHSGGTGTDSPPSLESLGRDLGYLLLQTPNPALVISYALESLVECGTYEKHCDEGTLALLVAADKIRAAYRSR
jgi:hypothetical protein